MKTQISVPDEQIKLFTASCDLLSIAKEIAAETPQGLIFTVETYSPIQIFYLGVAFGMEIGHQIHEQSKNQRP